MTNGMMAQRILLALLATVSLLGAACVSPPLRQGDFAAGGAPGAAYDLRLGYVYSNDAINAFEYMGQKCGGIFAGGAGSRSLTGVRHSLFQPILMSKFKSVSQFQTLEQAEAAGVDVVAILDLYANFSTGVVSESYALDMGARFQTRGRAEIDVVKAHGKAIGYVICGGVVTQVMSRAAGAFAEALNNSTKLAEHAKAHPSAPRAAPFPGVNVAATDASPLRMTPILTPSFSAPARVDDLAVIVGIESYSDIASKASYAERDADAFKAYIRALGVPERNIVLLKGSKAGKASLTKNLESWLPRMAKPNGRVYFYFSGHGAPDVKTGLAYLVPWDGDPNFLEDTAYPVAKLYKTLGALPAKQILVAMDSCFSGAGGRSVLASGARPLVGKIETGAVPANITVLAASASNEISGSLDDKGHGAFTYFLLEGLNAGKTTPKSLSDYLTPRVQDEARRLNRDQTPQLQGDGAWSLR